jgi:predicted DNA-binding transcriptional regulator AlpA
MSITTLHPNQPPSDIPQGIRILSYDELKTRGIRFSRVWIAHLIKEKKFPRPVNLGSAHVGFVETEIDAWLAGLIKARDEQAAPAE